MQHSLSDEQIINCLYINYGINVTTLSRLALGADLDSAVYKAEQDQYAYFVKLKHGHKHDIGISIIELLAKAKILQIIPPLTDNNGQSFHYLADFTLIVYPFITGQDGFQRALSDRQWLMLGEILKKIHALEVPSFLKNKLRQESFSSQWRETVRSMYKQIDTIPKSEEESAQKLLAFMKINKDPILCMVQRAEELAQQLKNETHELVLCHSDIHGGNVLIDNSNDAFYIVDWDAPMLAPKERDLMFIGGGVANVWNKPIEEDLFYKSYSKNNINLPMLAYYRFERIVEDIAIYAEQVLLSATDSNAKKEMYQHFIDMFKPNGVVDIAFDTEAKLVQ